MSSWIYTDADNTLWDTDAVFARAQLALLSAAEGIAGRLTGTTERLAFVREFDQAIATHHHQGLRYPPALLLRALASGINGLAADTAAERALAQGAVATQSEAEDLKAYSQTLLSVPPILSGVQRGLELARDNQIPVYVVSEGPLDVVRVRLQTHNIERLVVSSLSAQKTPELYARLKQRAAPHRAVMIGDQPDRDIRFASEAGLQTILIDSRFRPRWIQSADASQANVIVGDFFEAVSWVVNSESSRPA